MGLGGEISSTEAVASGWQRSLAAAVRDVETLWRRLRLPPADLPGAQSAPRDFPLLVPESYLRRMRPGDLHDPLLRQVLPSEEELVPVPHFLADPVQDGAARRAPGLLQKYHGRALLIAHGSCAIHCRYCFRRHYPYQDEPRAWEDWSPALQDLRQDASIHEVILSGGDPLILSDRRLERLVDELQSIPHLKRLRIHSRLPVVLPDRVTPRLLSLLMATRLQTIFVIHANHAQELQGDCAEALQALVAAGLPTLNQAVLLRGVNDCVESLANLCERCVDLGVMPYYLHQLDRVDGAAHFEVPVTRGLELIEELRSRLPGYAVPRYVQETPGDLSKRALS
jgi:EF-P beta-lysylation protein EpmB